MCGGRVTWRLQDSTCTRQYVTSPIEPRATGLANKLERIHNSSKAHLAPTHATVVRPDKYSRRPWWLPSCRACDCHRDADQSAAGTASRRRRCQMDTQGLVGAGGDQQAPMAHLRRRLVTARVGGSHCHCHQGSCPRRWRQ